MHERYADRGLRVVAVNAWDEPPTTVRKFVEELELPYMILMDGSEVFTGPYKGKGVPQTYLLDGTGEIRYAHLGWSDGDETEMARQIEMLLGG